MPGAVGSRRWRRRPVHIPTPLTGGPGAGRRSGAACAGPGARGRPQETASKAVRTSSSVMPISGALRRRRHMWRKRRPSLRWSAWPGRGRPTPREYTERGPLQRATTRPCFLGVEISPRAAPINRSVSSCPVIPAENSKRVTSGTRRGSSSISSVRSSRDGPPSVRLPVVRPRSFAPAQPHRTRGSLAERCSQQATQPL